MAITGSTDRADTGAAPPTRRTFTRGAAWSIPVIATATAAPAYAVSPCATHGTATATAPGIPVIVTVPTQCLISYTIIAGSGGRSGGGGAKLTGTFVITGSATTASLALIPGGGGASGTGATSSAGGLGYGRGGNAAAGNNGTRGGGGGGSAILLGAVSSNKPIVVAGGGGGGNGTYTNFLAGGPAIAVNPGQATGSDGGPSPVQLASGGPASVTNTALDQKVTAILPGGSSASGATVGAGANPAAGTLTYTAVHTQVVGFLLAGVAGGNNGTGNQGGGDGGNSVVYPTQPTSPAGYLATTYGWSPTPGGGGGGGYAGGGSGGTLAISGNTYFLGMGSGGGGGSNYTGGQSGLPGTVTGAAVTVSSSGVQPATVGAVNGANGSVTITW